MLALDENVEDTLTEIHTIYQDIPFTEELVESMCAEASKLMKLIDPETLTEKYKGLFDSE